ncbi:hypothetical protein HGA88_06135 [Candidatus Roizmanbacteria bacterium]|nr:hypothetical protein [Candidatus Roizmanbacteria bacterium]
MTERRSGADHMDFTPLSLELARLDEIREWKEAYPGLFEGEKYKNWQRWVKRTVGDVIREIDPSIKQRNKKAFQISCGPLMEYSYILSFRYKNAVLEEAPLLALTAAFYRETMLDSLFSNQKLYATPERIRSLRMVVFTYLYKQAYRSLESRNK